MSRSVKLPSQGALSSFLTTILPPHPADFSWFYHTPVPPKYFDITKHSKIASPVVHFVLGITPSENFYNTLEQLAKKCEQYYGWDWAHEKRVPKGVKGIVCFLHRPFDLDRRRLPRGVLVLASHKRFDEVLTTGYNVPLSIELGVSDKTERFVCLQGYKSDADRRYGFVGLLEAPKKLATLEKEVRKAFSGNGDLYQPNGWTVHTVQTQQDGKPIREIQHKPSTPIPDQEITVLANMNAFNDVTVGTVFDTCKERGWIKDESEATKILYVSGQPRELGLLAAQRLSMPAICVGHRPVEEWGIRYLAQKVKEEWADLHVETVLDDEEVNAQPATTRAPPTQEKEQVQSRAHLPTQSYANVAT